MRNTQLLLTLIFLFQAVSSPGCGDDESPSGSETGDPGSDLIGSWGGEGAEFMTFNDDGTFHSSADPLFSEGYWEVDGDLLILILLSGGTFVASFSADGLQFSAHLEGFLDALLVGRVFRGAPPLDTLHGHGSLIGPTRWCSTRTSHSLSL